MKVVASVVGTFIVVAILTIILGFAFGWFKTGVGVVSADNVKAQNEQVIGHYNDMIAAAKNTCTVQKAAKSQDERSALLVEDPTLAYTATFNRIVADYNSSVDNLFKAGIVKPKGYPESVDINSLDTEDWCSVPKQLLDLRK